MPLSAGALGLSTTAFGAVEQLTLGNVTERREFNGFGETTRAHADFNGADFFDRTYTLDTLGRIAEVSETIAGVTVVYAYGYDAAGRLSEVRVDGTLVRAYTYDSNGNRLQQTVGTPATGTYDDQDRLIAYGGTTYAYNEEGQCFAETTAGQTTIYAHDEFGWLRRVILPDDTQIDYLLDGQGRRVGKLVNGTLVRGWLYGPGPNPVAELDGAGAVVSRFIYASRPDVPDYLIKGGVTYRIIADQGQPAPGRDVATGAVVQRLDYDAFGQVLSDTNPGFQPFGFGGGWPIARRPCRSAGGATTRRWGAGSPPRHGSRPARPIGMCTRTTTRSIAAKPRRREV
ncbi:MAG: hypothetical protein U0841_02695 [Chloroflexia bacterium]